MSMPTIVPSNTTKDQAITDLIASIALEQTGLSHILNAEGEKIQAVIDISNITATELLNINKSIQNTVNSITKLEMVLQSKLEIFSSDINKLL